MSVVPTARFAFTDHGDAVHLPTCGWLDGRDDVTVVEALSLVPSRLHACRTCVGRVNGSGPVRNLTVDPDEIDDERSHPENATIGAEFERFVAERWPEISRVSDPDSPDWLDARFQRPLGNELAGEVAAEGTPVDAKSAALRTHSGERFGRWWFRRSHHDALLEAGGEYALGIYTRPAKETIAFEHAVLLPARTVDVLLEGRWYAAGVTHRAEECGQLPVSRVVDVSGGGGS